MTGKDQRGEVLIKIPRIYFLGGKTRREQAFPYSLQMHTCFTDAYMLPVDKCIGHKHTNGSRRSCSISR